MTRHETLALALGLHNLYWAVRDCDDVAQLAASGDYARWCAAEVVSDGLLAGWADDPRDVARVMRGAAVDRLRTVTMCDD